MMHLLVQLIIGGIAGWLASLIMKGRSQGLVINIIVGIVGAVLGSWLLGTLHLLPGNGLIPSIITATIGAVILLALIRLLKK